VNGERRSLRAEMKRLALCYEPALARDERDVKSFRAAVTPSKALDIFSGLNYYLTP
jgi:hypothetical protein